MHCFIGPSEELSSDIQLFLVSLHSRRNREKHGGGRRGSTIQWQRQEDPQASDNILQFTTTSTKQKISANAILGTSRESRASCVFGAYPNTGKLDFTLFIVVTNISFKTVTNVLKFE